MKKFALTLIVIGFVTFACDNSKPSGPASNLSNSSNSASATNTSNANISGAASNTANPSNSATAGNDPKSAIIDASHKLMALKSLTLEVDAAGETPFKKHIEYSAPDRYRVVYKDHSGAELDMIIGGGEDYIKSGDTWAEIPGDEIPSPTLRSMFSDESLKSLSDAKLEGEESVDGKPAEVYSYKYTTAVGNFPATSKLWISKSSGLPIKSYEEYSSGVVKSRTTTYDTEKPVTIELPTVKK